MRVPIVVAAEIFSAIVTQIRIRIGEIHHQPLYRCTKSCDDRAFPGFCHFGQNFRFDLEIPCVMHLACLEYRSGRRRCITTTLKQEL